MGPRIPRPEELGFPADDVEVIDTVAAFRKLVEEAIASGETVELELPGEDPEVEEGLRNAFPNLIIKYRDASPPAGLSPDATSPVH